jgi:hypothetical protein
MEIRDPQFEKITNDAQVVVLGSSLFSMVSCPRSCDCPAPSSLQAFPWPSCVFPLVVDEAFRRFSPWVSSFIRHILVVLVNVKFESV